MDTISFSKRLAAIISQSVQDSDMTKQQVANTSGIPWATFCRRLDHPENSFFTVPEIISVCEALQLNFIQVLTDAESALADEEVA